MLWRNDVSKKCVPGENYHHILCHSPGMGECLPFLLEDANAECATHYFLRKAFVYFPHPSSPSLPISCPSDAGRSQIEENESIWAQQTNVELPDD